MTDRPIPIPEGLDVIDDYLGVVIRRKWFSHVVWFLAIFAICWDSFLIGWYSMAAHVGKMGVMGWIFLIFPLGHVAVGVGLTYYCLCLFFNTTDILIRQDSLEIRTYPLPWIGSKIIPRQELTGFLVRKKRTGGDNGHSTSYKLSYVDSMNREKTLLLDFSNREQTDYICRYLTEFYRLSARG